MYERNAIILERYFNQMFGYNLKNNIKTNFNDFCDLVESLEKYKDISEDEDNIVQDYDIIANKIRDIQKKQETLNKKNMKYQHEREELFQSIDENSEVIQKKFENVNNNIKILEEQIQANAIDFTDIVTEFGEKSTVRAKCGRTRREVETEYNNKLNKILDDYKDIDIEIERKAKQFVDIQTEEIEEELKEKIRKNGEKEKIPFNMEVITKAITLSVDVQKRETEILAGIYDKTNKLFNEIKNNTTKIDKHKKAIKDSKSKLKFVSALKEYLVQFLDNERLSAVNGEEHDKLMKEACENLDEDLVQINNLYTLLLKEISKKITKKSYTELYNIEYLRSLEQKSEEFERQIKKLNLPVTIINPNYWRIEGMKKIYNIFYEIVTEEYGRDLSEYMPEEDIKENDDDWDFEEDKIEEEKSEKKKDTKIKTKRKIKNMAEEDKSEIDKKIDLILGFGEEDIDWEEEDNLDTEAEEDDDDVYYDIWGNDIKDKDEKNMDNEEAWEDDDEEDYSDEDWEDDEEDDDSNEDWEDDEEDNDNDENWKDDEDDDAEDWEDDIWDDEEATEEMDKNKPKNEADDWENEFVNMDEKKKKKKSFFDKFKK